MIVVYTSDDAGYAERKCRQRIAKDHPDLDREMDFVRFDAAQDPLTNIVSEAYSCTFTGETKVVLVANPNFLDERVKRSKTQTEKDLAAFEEYLKSPNPGTDLYLAVEGSLGRGSLAKLLKSKAEVTDAPLPKGEELALGAMKIAASLGSTIERAAANMVVERTGESWWTFYNAMEKLCLYTDHITAKTVDALIPRRLEDRIFMITEPLLNGRATEAITTYRDLRRNIEAIPILNYLFSEFRTDAQVLYLAERGLSDAEIGSSLSLNPYRAKMIRQKMRGRLSWRTCVRILDDLAQLEVDVKFELDDPDIRLETFLLTFRQRYVGRR